MLGKGKIQKVGKNKQKAKMHTDVGKTQKVEKRKKKVGKNKQKAKMHTAVGNTQKVGKSKHKAKMGTGTSLCFKLL